jgi:hypothetical protein
MEVKEDDVDEDRNEIGGRRMYWDGRIECRLKMDEMDEQEEEESG